MILLFLQQLPLVTEAPASDVEFDFSLSSADINRLANGSVRYRIVVDKPERTNIQCNFSTRGELMQSHFAVGRLSVRP